MDGVPPKTELPVDIVHSQLVAIPAGHVLPAAARLLDANLSAKEAQLHLSGNLPLLPLIARLPSWSLHPVFPAAAFSCFLGYVHWPASC